MTISKGLEGVVVDETAVSDVVGRDGRLYYRGYSIEELIQRDFTEVAWLVLFGELPNVEEARALTRFLNTHANPRAGDVALLDALADDVHPMLALQGLVPLADARVASEISWPSDNPEAGTGLALVARLAGIVAALRAREQSRPYIPFEPERAFLDSFLRSFNANEPTRSQLEVFNVVQVMQMEHSFNASTFACRVAASTLAPVASALSAGIGTLFGRLHGRADEEAMEFALGVQSPSRACEAVRSALASGERVMGMGHREYKTVDPRAAVLKPMARDLCRGTPAENLFATLAAIEDAFQAEMAKRGKEIHANLEFYKGPVYSALGIPARYFTAFFATSRAFGYLAHFLESRLDNRLVRPQGRYTGPAPRHLGA